ncbi:MAG: acyl-ACP--UDP-N-acetylglucosamine O-acyltransferase, partial [Gammaproteobacteria bacterium]|nr:acyl-ACP--UDP-N-acetylglucosamine O-acyltransferase [Gammaproteobacteria bacterium]
LRESVTVHRASREKMATELGDNNYLMAQAHIAHDCRLGNNVILAPNAAIGGFVTVDDRAFISGGVMIHQFARVGRLAMLGGNTKLTQDALPFMITDGVPGEVRGLNLVGLKRAGFKLEELRILKQAYKLLFRSGLSLQEIISQLRALDSPPASHLAEFISDSRRSFHRARE